MYSHKKVEIQTQTRKNHTKMKNMSCALKDEIQEFCLLVHMNLKFVIFVNFLKCEFEFQTFSCEYIFVCTMMCQILIFLE
jgi:hypothetical protein